MAKRAMNEIFEECHKFTAAWEGGFSDHPSDRGGVTNFGVSLAFLTDLAKSQAGSFLCKVEGIKQPICRESIISLTRAQAAALFRHEFWKALNLDYAHPVFALAIYDCAVNHGRSRAVKFFQKAWNETIASRAKYEKLAVDGVCGPKTRSALCADLTEAELAGCALRIVAERTDFYQGIVESRPSQKAFLKGWLNRARALKTEITAKLRVWGTAIADGERGEGA